MSEDNYLEIESKAIWYLEKYATSSENLRRYLKRKVMNTHLNSGSEENINKIIQSLQSQKLLNDKLFAESKIRSLFNKGWSIKRIRFKLKQLGVAGSLIQESLKELGENEIDIDLVSAINLVKKKSIGPYRKVKLTDKIKNREFGILSRAGFSYAISKKVLVSMNRNEIEEIKQ